VDDGIIIISPDNEQRVHIFNNIQKAKSLAQSLGFQVPSKPFLIVDCSNLLAKLPPMGKFGGHYQPLLNTVFLYQPTPNNIFHEYFHFIQDNQYGLDFSNSHSYWVLESSARWFENFTLDDYPEIFDCCTDSLFEPNYSNRYERWMLFRNLLAYGPQVIPGIFHELKDNPDPCTVLNRLSFFKTIVIDLITSDFQRNFAAHYKNLLNSNKNLITEPFQFSFTLIDGPLHLVQEDKIHYLVFNKNLQVLSPASSDINEEIYQNCYILGVINLCDSPKTIQVFQDNQKRFFYTYVNP